MSEMLLPPRGKAGALARVTPGMALSAHEARMLALLADGATTLEVGLALAYSRDTVASQLSVLYRKLGARNRAHAVSLGFAPHGFVSDPAGRLVAKPPPVESTELLISSGVGS